MTLQLRTLLTAASVFLCGLNLYAGGWTQKEDEGYFKLGGQYIHAQKYYDPDGNLLNIRTQQDFTLSFYGEYGFTDYLTGILYLPLFKRITLNRQVGRVSGVEIAPGVEVNDLSDIDVGFRYGILQEGPTVLAAGVSFGIPIGQSDPAEGPLTGDGEFNQIITLQAGHSFYPVPMYATAEIGANNRTEGFSDELRFALEAGYSFGDRLTAIARVRGVRSLHNGTRAAEGSAGGSFNPDQSYLAYGPEILYTLRNGFGLSAGIETGFGTNTLASPTYSLGIVYKLVE